MTPYIENLLAKARWRQELNKHGYEGTSPMASERLTETLRAELRSILDNEGKPFDLQVARHVYDFAIAAKDLLTVSVKSVEDAMRVVADNKGAMESLTGPDEEPPAEVASETFGSRIMRELFALLPTLRNKNAEDPVADPVRLVTAIADARERGMHELAAKLEEKLVGTSLEPAQITKTEVVTDSYEHGFLEGSMQDNFDRGVIDGHVIVHPEHWTPAYREGFEAGRARRALKDAAPALPAPADSNDQLRGTEQRYLDPASGTPNVPPLCEACQKYPRPTGTPCLECRAMSGRKFARPPSGMENASDPEFNFEADGVTP